MIKTTLKMLKFLKIRRFKAQKKPLLTGGIIIVVAIASIITGVYLFSVYLYPSEDYRKAYVVPRGSETIPLDRIIRIGVLNDMNWISGDHAWKGALLAAREINEKGGIMVNGTQYYIGLVRENTNEVYDAYSDDYSNGVNAAEYMINNHHPHFIIGGTFWGAIMEYLEVIMDKKIPFLSTGTADFRLCEWVRSDYERYKYIFRIMPISDVLFRLDIAGHIRSLANHLNLTYGGTVDKIAFLSSNWVLALWCDDIEDRFSDYNLTVVADIEFSPENATLADFETYWNQIEIAEAQITVLLDYDHFNERGIDIAQQYQAVKPHSLLFILNFFSTTSPYWDDAKGACQFEVVYQALHNTSKTSLTIPFFNSFVKEYGVEPYFNAPGSYDAVYLLKHAVNESQSFNSDIIVKTLEKINTSNPFTGVSSKLAFTSNHELLTGYPFGHGILCQYKYIDGTKVVIPSSLTYPDSIASDSLRLPYWGINGLLTDPPDPPGDFTLDTDAESPDYDGIFNLTWTDSVGADNYSIYMSDNPITYISKKFDLLAYQTATSPFPISLKKGEHYFRVVAYNETGETMSSNYTQVIIPGPGDFILDTINASDPDPDGDFNLIWTGSERADNYSVYQYDKIITEINGNLTCLANQTTARSFPVTGLTNGKYYFAVAAYNEMGYTLSDYVEVVVQIPPDWTIIFIVSISAVVGVASIGLGWRYLKYREKKKAERERREPIIVEDMIREPLERKKPEDKNKSKAKDK